MADEGRVIAYTAGEALVEGRVVTYNTSDNDVEYADAVTEKVMGITTKDCDSGDEASIQVTGVYENATADGSGTEIEPGDLLMPKSGSDGILVIHDGQANSVYAARALSGTTAAAGRIIIELLGSLPAEA